MSNSARGNKEVAGMGLTRDDAMSIYFQGLEAVGNGLFSMNHQCIALYLGIIGGHIAKDPDLAETLLSVFEELQAHSSGSDEPEGCGVESPCACLEDDKEVVREVFGPAEVVWHPV